MAGSGYPCIYCELPADSEEHIFGTWLMADLENFTGRHALHGQLKYPDGRMVPLSVTTNRKGKREFNFTSDTICAHCNGGWMNTVDQRARSYVQQLLGGHQVTANGKMRKAVASWAVKTAITARFAHLNPTPVEGEWAKQLKTDHSHLPSPLWLVWLARYIGGQDLWFHQSGLDIAGAIPITGRPTDNSPAFSDGVVTTLAIGQLCVQVLRINGPAVPLTMDTPAALAVWPKGPVTSWPPPEHIDDSSLQAFADRFLSAPMIGAVLTPAPEEAAEKRAVALFQGPKLTPDMLTSNETYALTVGFDCQCGVHTDATHDTGGPLRDLKVPYTFELSCACGGCGAVNQGTFTIATVPGF